MTGVRARLAIWWYGVGAPFLWKRLQLAGILALCWLGVMSVLALIAAPCRMFLRFHDVPVPYDAPAMYDVLGFFAGILVLAGIAVLLLERSDRRRRRG
jgi:hypothetical protein